MWNFRECCVISCAKKKPQNASQPATHISRSLAALLGSTAQLPAPRPPTFQRPSDFPTVPSLSAMTQTLGRRDDELTPMAGATGTSAHEAPPNLVVGWMTIPSLKRTAFWHPENGWRFQVRNLQTSSLSIFSCELLVSGSVSPYAHCPLGPCFFQQVDFGGVPTLRFPWRKLCNVICLDLPPRPPRIPVAN